MATDVETVVLDISNAESASLFECPICLESIDFTNNPCTLDCTHKYHLMCFLEWVSQKAKLNSVCTCPCCTQHVTRISWANESSQEPKLIYICRPNAPDNDSTILSFWRQSIGLFVNMILIGIFTLLVLFISGIL